MHSGPKAAIDGAVIALLIGKSGRWRCLALLGCVYGLVLLLQIGMIYLLPVMALAGIIAAGLGRLIGFAHRAAGIFVAAATYEWLASFGGPIRIYFSTGGHSEPFVWALWLGEWPMRIVGAMIGVWLAQRWLVRKNVRVPHARTSSSSPSVLDPYRAIRTHSPAAAAVRIGACTLGCILPMYLQSAVALAALAVVYLAFALSTGLRFRILTACEGLLASWILFACLSFAWHHDVHLVTDLGRTLFLRFLPLALSSVVLVTTVRPVDLIRLLDTLRITRAILIPLATVVRSIPKSRRQMRESLDAMRAEYRWIEIARHPIRTGMILVGPQIKDWAHELAD